MNARRVCLVIALSVAPHLVEAQRVELEVGGGYVFGGGTENPGPSLPTLNAAVVAWPWSRWGIAVRLVKGPGEDLHQPVASLDRTFLGQADLQYWTVTARRRIRLTGRNSVELGFGQLFGGRFATVQELGDPPRRTTSPDSYFPLGSALETFVSHAVGRHVAIKGGLTFDFNLETTNLQPVLLCAVRF